MLNSSPQAEPEFSSKREVLSVFIPSYELASHKIYSRLIFQDLSEKCLTHTFLNVFIKVTSAIINSLVIYH